MPASELTPVKPPVWRRVAVAAVFLANGALLSSWVSRIPAVQSKLQLTTGQLGLALLGVAAGAILAMPFAGRLSAKWGSRLVTIAGIGITCAALPLAAVAPNGIALALALALLGFGSGATDVAMNTQAVAVEQMYRRSIMPSFHGLWSVGAMAGAAIGGECASLNLAPLPHLIGASLILGALGLFAALRGMIPAALDQHMNHDESPALRFSLPARPLLVIGIVAFCSLMAEGSMADWDAVYLHRDLRTGQQLAADGYAGFAFAMAIGRFCGDSLTHRFGSVALTRACGILAAAGLGLALAVGTVPAALIGFALVGAGLSITVPIFFSAAGNMPGLAPGPSIATVSTLGYTGFLVGPPAIGFAAEALHLRGALWIVVAACALIALSAGSVNAAERVRNRNPSAM